MCGFAVWTQDVFGEENDSSALKETPEVGDGTTVKRKRVPRFEEVVEEPELVPGPPSESPGMLTKMQVQEWWCHTHELIFFCWQ